MSYWMVLKCFLKFVPFLVSSESLSISAYIEIDLRLLESSIWRRLYFMSAERYAY